VFAKNDIVATAAEAVEVSLVSCVDVAADRVNELA
jgi:hypothetical protein